MDSGSLDCGSLLPIHSQQPAAENGSLRLTKCLHSRLWRGRAAAGLPQSKPKPGDERIHYTHYYAISYIRRTKDGPHPMSKTIF